MEKNGRVFDEDYCSVSVCTVSVNVCIDKIHVKVTTLWPDPLAKEYAVIGPCDGTCRNEVELPLKALLQIALFKATGELGCATVHDKESPPPAPCEGEGPSVKEQVLQNRFQRKLAKRRPC